MIDEEATFKKYGYRSDELSHGSGKFIVRICEKCGKSKVIKRCDYRDLCPSCTLILRYKDPSERRKMSEAALKYYEDPLSRKKTGDSVRQAHIDDPTIIDRMSKSQTKRYEDPSEREKNSYSMIKHYAEIDDPKLEMVEHHIAYDFERPEAFKVEITKSRHGAIHHPKGQPVTKHGYSLID